MTTRASTTRSYVRDLTMWLQLRDVDGVRIGQIVAEVESHVAESGEPAEVAFGPARTYAKQFGTPRDRWRVSPATVVTTVAAAGGGWLLAEGFFHLLIGQRYAGLPAWIVALGGALVLVAVFLVVPSNLVVDPRRRARPGRARATLLATVGVLLATLLALLWVLSLFVD